MLSETAKTITRTKRTGPEKGTLLVVDDLPDNLLVLNEILTLNGYDVRSALGGFLALEYLKTHRPDLILLDIKMPDMDGFEVCKRLKADATLKDIPVIFVSAIGDTDSKIKGFEVGCVDFVAKPFDLEEILARISTHLTLRRLRDQLEKQNIELRKAAFFREEIEHVTQHDLKGILSALVTLPASIEKSGSLNEKQQKRLQVIEEAGKRMMEMLNRSLEMFQLEADSYQFDEEDIDVINIITKTIEMFEDEIKRKQLSIHFTLNGKSIVPGNRFLIRGEGSLFFQLFENTIKNAVEASVTGQPVEICLSKQSINQIVIHNQSPVPEKIQARFFEKFTTMGKIKGTGLGTYSAKMAVERMGGSITMTSSETSGTSINVSFPKSKLIS